MEDIIYCRQCGQKNQENNYKCTQCGVELHLSPRLPVIIEDDNTLGGLIPYKNGQALASYYLGVFSFIPVFGILPGVAAVITGILGLRRCRLTPQIRGGIHAGVGLFLGAVCTAGNVLLIFSIVKLLSGN